MSTDTPSYEEHIEDLFPPIVPDEVGMVWVNEDAVIITRGEL